LERWVRREKILSLGSRGRRSVAANTPRSSHKPAAVDGMGIGGEQNSCYTLDE